MARRVIMGAYGAWMVALGLVYFVLVPGQTASAVVWLVIGLSSTLAILAGVWLHRPRRVVPWLLLAAGVCAYAAGDAVYSLTEQLQYGPAASWRHVDDAFYVVVIALVLTGLIQLARSSGPDLNATIDALILMCGVGLLTWIFLVESATVPPKADRVDEIIMIAYPLADVVVLAAVTRLVSASRWTATTALFAVGTVGLLVSDTLYRLTRTDGIWTVPRVVGVGWFLLYACWGAAALHPSMRALTEPRSVRPRETSPLSLAMLALSAMIPPAVLLAEALARGPVRHGVVIALASAAMFLLVLIRLATVGSKLRERIARERSLRTVIAALVSAADTPAVTAALNMGVRQLMPEDGHKLLLSSDQDLAGHPVHDLRTDQLMPTAALPDSIAAQLGTFPMTLACPLVLPDHPMGEDYLGVLLVGAPEASLVHVRDSLAVLASQAALAIDRVALSRELIRRNSEEYFRALVHHTADVILILGEDDSIQYASPSAAAVFGTSPLVGTHLLGLIADTDRDTAAQALALVRAAGPDAASISTGAADWTVRAPDGTPVQVEASWRDLRADPAVRGIVVTLRDVTEQRRLERELTHRAYHDALTGLANRVLFAERIQEAIAETQHTGGVAGVLLIDLDDFKMVNDTLGHEFGDKLLLAIARRLTELIRPRDTAARLGGDEFAVLIEDARDAANVEEVAARIAGALREPFNIAGQLVNGTASIGVGTTADADGGPDLLRQADLALYVAKDAGKGQWRRYQTHLHLAVSQRMTLRTELDTAIRRVQLTVDYQPIVALSDGSTTGFEALVRWNHPTRGRLLPGAFIDVAEETGLVAPMGDWVLRTSLDAAALWRESWPAAPPYVSVNVSVQQFRSPGFVDRVARELALSGVPPQGLMLEITESLLLRDDDQVWDDLAELRQVGVRVAIDDFGTGYSSLSYLRHVPLDVLKIDRLFTAAMSTSSQQRALVDGIVRLARTLGLQVIAEGVETSAERELLTQIGCPYGQGFLFSQPMPLADTMQWLQREHITA